MIMDDKVVKQADALVKSVKVDDAHPDLAALLGSYARVKDSGANDRVVFAHARPLVRLAESLGVEAKAPAKKTATKTAAKKTTSRRKG